MVPEGEKTKKERGRVRSGKGVIEGVDRGGGNDKSSASLSTL